MPRNDTFICIINFNCDWCGAHVKLDDKTSKEKVMATVNTWVAVADASALPAKETDPHRWYDSIDCLIAGEQKAEREKREALQKRAEQDKQLEMASAALAAASPVKN